MYPMVLISLILAIIIPDLFFYHKLSKRTSKNILFALHFLPGVLFIASFLYIRFGLKNTHSFQLTSYLMWLILAFISIYIPKIIYAFFHFFNFSVKKILVKETNLFRYVGLVMGTLALFLILYGGFFTPSNFKLRKVVIEIAELPAAFNGYRIIQFSDFHIGNWDQNYAIMAPISKLMNDQNPDMIVFTGDMVNNFANEANGWEPYFKQLKSKHGNYAIMGNHDYGNYAVWKSQKERDENLRKTKQAIRNLGFRLLLNENISLKRGSAQMVLIGVEDWGMAPPLKYGDLKKAMRGTEKIPMKILLSHDPSHWDAQVVGRERIPLTLSGHTHGGQLGYRFENSHHSPSSFVFEQWDGLYQKEKQFLYVNTGLGFVGMRLRIGIPPEITLIELRCKK